MSEKKDARIASAKSGKKGPSQGPAKVISIPAPAGYNAVMTELPARPVAQTDEEQKAVSAFDNARVGVAKVVPGDKASEGRYSVAYQKLVQLGLAPQIKKKYR